MSTNSALRALLAVLMMVFVGFVAWSLHDPSAKEGGPAPGFAIRADNGQQVTPEQFGGKVLVLNFWATWCQPCIQEIPSLNQFQRRYQNQGVRVVAISIDRNETKYRNFLEHFRVSFVTARDPKADISGRYGTFQIPETYIIKDGRVVRKYGEGRDWNSPDVNDFVKGLL